MKQIHLNLFTVAVLCLFMSGVFTLAIADNRKDDTPTSRSKDSSTSQPSIKKSVKPPEKLPGYEPTGRRAPNKISTPPSRREIVVTGFCCKEGSLEETTEEVCLKRMRGKFFPDKNIALKSCKGWCCNEFEVSLTSSKQCSAMQGKFFANKSQSERFCAAQKGWCCVDGTNLRLTMSQCAQKKGSFFTSQSQAHLACRRSIDQPASADRSNSGSAIMPSRVVTGTSLKPILPDLEITRTWLDRNCVMQVDIKNSGGPIAEPHFNQARMRVSAGPKSTLPQAKSYLKYADPQKNLLMAGGKVTYDTGLKVSGSAQSLVWVDTDHHIQESIEINNGDDAVLTCNAPLTWCCTKRGAVQMIADECETMGGATHKTETDAVKKCGPPEDTSRSQALKTDEGKKNAASKLEFFLSNSQSQVFQTDVSQGSAPPTPNINPMPYDNNLPNLAISNVNVIQLPGSPEVTINFQVINTGAAVEDTFTVSLYRRGGSQLDSVNIFPPMEPNAIRDLQFTFQSSSTLCLNNIGIRVDSNNTVNESDEVGQSWAYDEQDNVWWGELPTLVAGECQGFLQPLVPAIPARLVVMLQQNIIADPNTPGSENIQVTAKVKNVGTVESSAQTTINIQLTDQPYLHYLDLILPFWEETIPRLPPNAEHTVTRTFTIPAQGLDGQQILPGQFRLLSIVNQENLQPYEQVVNGELIFQYNGLLPDLVVCFKKYNAHHPGKNSYPPKIKNIGTAPSNPANLRFYIQSKGVTNHSIPSLPVGGEYTVKRDVRWWLYEMGTKPNMSKIFSLNIDDQEEVLEGIIGESNNVINGSILIKRWQHDINPGQNSQTQCSNVPGMAN